MTVGHLKAIFDREEYDDEQQIVIGQRQNFGSNFVYNICEAVEENGVRKFYGKDIKDGVVMLIMGSQIGVIKDSYDNDEDDDDYDDENFE